MPLFVIHCLDKDGAADIRLANRAAHLDGLKALGDAVKLAGPLQTADGAAMVGSLLVIDFPDLDAAQAWAAGDAYAQAGLFQSVSIHRYKQVIPAE